MLRRSYDERLTAAPPIADSGGDDPAVDGDSAVGTMDRATMERALAGVLERFGLTDAAPEMLQELATHAPQLFFAAGISRLELERGTPLYRKRSLRLLDAPAFLLELVRPERFSIRELTDFCAKYVREDPLLDVKLARLMPGRRCDSYNLASSLILRIMEVLDEISPGPRLLMIIGHLTNYPEQHVASKAALLVGRRLQSRLWVEHHISSTDPRVRANVIEALWGVDSALAGHTLRKSLHDANNRVHGNALVGLHMLGDQSVKWRILHLTKDKRPAFRQTAAWVIKKIGAPEFAPLLEGLLQDPIQGVRRSAESALERLSGAAYMTFEPDSSPNIGVEVAPDRPKTGDIPAKPAIEGEPAPMTPHEILAPVNNPGENAELVPARQPCDTAITLQLDGRYLTGAC
jgi:hypothetical protein